MLSKDRHRERRWLTTDAMVCAWDDRSAKLLSPNLKLEHFIKIESRLKFYGCTTSEFVPSGGKSSSGSTFKLKENVRSASKSGWIQLKIRLIITRYRRDRSYRSRPWQIIEDRLPHKISICRTTPPNKQQTTKHNNHDHSITRRIHRLPNSLRSRHPRRRYQQIHLLSCRLSSSRHYVWHSRHY